MLEMGQTILNLVQMQPIFDWDFIHREYVQGFVVADPETGDRRSVYPTYEDLANKHGCHIDTIRHKASKQKPTWAEQRSALKAKLSEREDNHRVSYYVTESAALDAEILSLVRDHLRLVRYFVDQYQPLLNEDGMIVGKATLETKFKIQDLEISSRTLKNLQEIGRRAVSEPVAGVREIIAEMKDDNVRDANALRSQIERLQKRLKNRAKQKESLGSKSDR
jgi:gas vesicle protein